MSRHPAVQMTVATCTGCAKAFHRWPGDDLLCLSCLTRIEAATKERQQRQDTRRERRRTKGRA